MDSQSILQRASVTVKKSGIVLSEDQSAAAVTVDSRGMARTSEVGLIRMKRVSLGLFRNTGFFSIYT